MDFSADTGKVRRMIGPMNELEGLRGEHTLLLDSAGKFRITRMIPVLAKTYARLIDKTTTVPDTTLLPSMSPDQLASLQPTHVLY